MARARSSTPTRRVAARRFRAAACALALAWAGCGDEPADAPPEPVAAADEVGLDAEEARQMEELLALGYVQAAESAPERAGVTVNEPGAAPGVNLAVSGHGPEAVLFDMAGNEIHRWRRAYREVWPGRKQTNWYRSERYWRRAHLLPNGDLLVVFDGLGLVKLDRDSNVLWETKLEVHHDLEVVEDGRIYTLTRRSRLIPEVNESEKVLEDFVSILDPEGNEIVAVSLYEAVRKSDYADWLETVPRKGDIFHTNTVELLDGRLAGISDDFRAGNVLISIHRLSGIGVVDLDAGELVWGRKGSWRHQHQPTVVEPGHILLFDNLGGRKRSSAIEIDPATGEEVWRYRADEPDVFHSLCCGSVQRLPGGSTLITDSEKGRAFEIDRDGTLLWEYYNPHRVEGDGETKIAMLYEVVRLPPDFPLGWAASPPSGARSR